MVEVEVVETVEAVVEATARGEEEEEEREEGQRFGILDRSRERKEIGEVSVMNIHIMIINV